MKPSLYDILGVARDATQRDIKAAYRKRAAASHPDKGGSDAEAQAINEAWETLGDPDRRARYDATGQVEGVAPTMSPGETIFMETLESVMRAVVDDDEASMTTEICNRLQKRYGALSRDHANLKDRIIRLGDHHFGRYFSATGENLIESHLRATQSKLIVIAENMDRELHALLDAIAIANGYVDVVPAEVRSPRRNAKVFGFRAVGWDQFSGEYTER